MGTGQVFITEDDEVVKHGHNISLYQETQTIDWVKSQAFKGKIKEQRVKQKTVYRHLEH